MNDLIFVWFCVSVFKGYGQDSDQHLSFRFKCLQFLIVDHYLSITGQKISCMYIHGDS